MTNYYNNKKKIKGYIDHLYDKIYREKPVDIITFLKNPYYLGKSTKNLSAIYPGWIPVLKQIFMDDSKYIIVFTGAIGIGKTTIAIYCMAYILYRIMCLKDPYTYFGKSDFGKMTVSFFNLTKSLGNSKGFENLMNVLMQSKWFYDHGGFVTGTKLRTMNLNLFQWVLSSPYAKGFGVVGHSVITGILDEVDSQNESDGQRKRVLDTYTATVRRFESRFVIQERSLGKLFLVSSKMDELSFLDMFVNEMKDSSKVLIIDKPQWEIFPKTQFSGITFPVMTGDAYNNPRILTDREEERNKWIKDGFHVIDVPVEYREEFSMDIIGALRDIAGIAVRGTRRYKLFPHPDMIKFDTTKEDPLYKSSFSVGLEDNIPWITFIDMSKIRIEKSVPRYIHLDIAISGDAMGLACSCIKGWELFEIENEEGNFTNMYLPIVETDFTLRIVARERDRIPLAEMRKFILNLRAQGLNIKKFTADLRLASEDTLQILRKSKIDADYYSVDTNTQAYMDFRNLVIEGRWHCHKQPWLNFEMRHIEHDRDKNKVDHPDKVQDIEFLEDGDVREIIMDGSKDVLDATVGSVFQALINTKRKMSVDEAKKLLNNIDDINNSNSGLSGDWFINKSNKSADIILSDDDKNKAMIDLMKRMNNG